jgi:hypothetical protein
MEIYEYRHKITTKIQQMLPEDAFVDFEIADIGEPLPREPAGSGEYWKYEARVILRFESHSGPEDAAKDASSFVAFLRWFGNNSFHDIEKFYQDDWQCDRCNGFASYEQRHVCGVQGKINLCNHCYQVWLY